MGLVLAPSILSIDFTQMGDSLLRSYVPNYTWLHIDVMDGHFVPNISFGPPVISCVRKILPDAFFDVHMMVENPNSFIKSIKNCGADMFTFHVETTATNQLQTTIESIRSAGMRVGIALNPDTPISQIDAVLPLVDMVLIMSVNPGFGGQKMIMNSLDKIQRLGMLKREKQLNFDIEIDGGVNLENIENVIASGANVIVAGSAIYNGDVSSNVERFLKIMGYDDWRS